MSAYIVGKENIDIIVTALQPLTQEVGNEIGRKLWVENLRSVAWRSGPSDFMDIRVKEYEWSERERSPQQVMQVVGTYRYQSCEHAGWPTSPACLMVAALEESYPKSAALGLPRVTKTPVSHSRMEYVSEQDIHSAIFQASIPGYRAQEGR